MSYSEAEFLNHYDANQFDRPSVTVDMLIFTVMNEAIYNYRKLPQKTMKLLLIKRKNHPYKDEWALPGGFVNMDESLDDAAKRELKEETNIEGIYLEQLYSFGNLNRDPRTRVISCAYLALVDSTKLQVKAGDDAKEAEWFDVTAKLIEKEKVMQKDGYKKDKLYKISLRNGDVCLDAIIKVTINAIGTKISIKREIVESNHIAFDHAKIIHYGLERLKNKIEYTDIAFSFMPEKFSLTELQQVYEVILDKQLLKANFRRKIENMVLETDQYLKAKGHRPSKLYTYNPDWVDQYIERRN